LPLNGDLPTTLALPGTNSPYYVTQTYTASRVLLCSVKNFIFRADVKYSAEKKIGA